MSRTQTLFLCLGIVLLAVGVTTVIFFTEPTAQRSGATKTTPMLADVITVQRDTVQPTIRAMGTVEPVQDVVLRPRVGGEILRRSSSFTPGGVVERGETLLQIDPADYRNVLQQRKSDLRQAEADLKVEMGRQNVAAKDYQLLGDSLSAENRALVLREPQLNAARSQVEAARAAVDQAELDLERTSIKAPFDALILRRSVNVGSQVGTGDELARLVGRDAYWVEATVPLSTLRRLAAPDGEDAENVGSGPPVRVRNRTAWEDGAHREGRLTKVVGALEDRTRMARVLITVPDPHATRPEHDGQPRLMIGSYVEAEIEGETLPGVIRLNRDYLRDDDTVWVMEDGRLRIREVDVVFRDAHYAYIRDGLNDGTQVVTTNLTTIQDGAPLRLNGSDESPEQRDVPDPAQ